MEEDTCEAKIPHTNVNMGRKHEMLGGGSCDTTDACRECTATCKRVDSNAPFILAVFAAAQGPVVGTGFSIETRDPVANVLSLRAVPSLRQASTCTRTRTCTRTVCIMEECTPNTSRTAHTHHTPHATHHTPHATRHTPHATHHTPHATRRTSHAAQSRHSVWLAYILTKESSHTFIVLDEATVVRAQHHEGVVPHPQVLHRPGDVGNLVVKEVDHGVVRLAVVVLQYITNKIQLNLHYQALMITSLPLPTIRLL